MKQTQVGVHPLLSVTVIAGLLGLAGYGQAAMPVEATGLPGFSQPPTRMLWPRLLVPP